jgi:hypothetical protein
MKKITIPATREELYAGLDGLLESKTMGRAVSELLAQALWVQKTRSEAHQVEFAHWLGRFLDAYVAKQKGASFTMLDALDDARKGGAS